LRLHSFAELPELVSLAANPPECPPATRDKVIPVGEATHPTVLISKPGLLTRFAGVGTGVGVGGGGVAVGVDVGGGGVFVAIGVGVPVPTGVGVAVCSGVGVAVCSGVGVAVV
jgi:hypothetical protein